LQLSIFFDLLIVSWLGKSHGRFSRLSEFGTVKTDATPQE